MALGIYINGVLKVRGDGVYLTLGALDSTATFTIAAPAGYQNAAEFTIPAMLDCEFSKDGVTYSETLTFAQGEVLDTDFTVTIKRVTVTGIENTYTGFETLPSRLALVATELQPDITAPVISGTLTATAGDTSVTIVGPTATDAVGIAKWQYRVDAGAWVDIADSANGTMPSTVVGSLTNGVEYDFEVRALDAADNASDPSNTATATPVSDMLTIDFTGDAGAAFPAPWTVATAGTGSAALNGSGQGVLSTLGSTANAAIYRGDVGITTSDVTDYRVKLKAVDSTDFPNSGNNGLAFFDSATAPTCTTVALSPIRGLYCNINRQAGGTLSAQFNYKQVTTGTNYFWTGSVWSTTTSYAYTLTNDTYYWFGIDTSASGVMFTLYAADGTTVLAQSSRVAWSSIRTFANGIWPLVGDPFTDATSNKIYLDEITVA